MKTEVSEISLNSESTLKNLLRVFGLRQLSTVKIHGNMIVPTTHSQLALGK